MPAADAVCWSVSCGEEAGAWPADEPLEEVAAWDLLQGAAGATGHAGCALGEVAAAALGAVGQQVEHAGSHLGGGGDRHRGSGE